MFSRIEVQYDTSYNQNLNKTTIFAGVLKLKQKNLYETSGHFRITCKGSC